MIDSVGAARPVLRSLSEQAGLGNSWCLGVIQVNKCCVMQSGYCLTELVSKVSSPSATAIILNRGCPILVPTPEAVATKALEAQALGFQKPALEYPGKLPSVVVDDSSHKLCLIGSEPGIADEKAACDGD